MSKPTPGQQMTPEELAARKRRNLWLALALFGFVFLVGATTVVRLSQTGMGPGQEFYWHADN